MREHYLTGASAFCVVALYIYRKIYASIYFQFTPAHRAAVCIPIS